MALLVSVSPQRNLSQQCTFVRKTEKASWFLQSHGNKFHFQQHTLVMWKFSATFGKVLLLNQTGRNYLSLKKVY